MDNELEFRKVKALEEIADRLTRIESLITQWGQSEGW